MYFNNLLQGVTWYPFLFDTPFNATRAVCIWLSVAFVIAYLVCLFTMKGEKRKSFFAHSVFVWVAYACLLCTVALTLSFLEDGIKPILFFPLLFLLVSIVFSAVVLLFKRTKTLFYLLGGLCLSCLIATFVCMGIHFSSGEAALENWLTNEAVDSLTLYVSSALSILILFAILWIFGKKEKREFDSKSITYAAVCIAMSFALSYLRIVRLPQGGSITPASLLPLMLYAYLFGVRKGVFAGFTYGLLQALQDPSILHPAQFLLDYPVAFAWIGIAGIFTKNKALTAHPILQFTLGATLAGMGRFCMHFLSGAFAFGYFAPEGTPVLLYSFLYQAGYVLPDLAIAIIAGALLFTSKAFLREVHSQRNAL